MGTAGDNMTFNFPSSTVQNTVSSCVPVYTNWPQSTVSSPGQIDAWYINASDSFITFQLENLSDVLQVGTECGSSGSGGNCSSFLNGGMPTSTWEIACHVQTLGANGSSFQAIWATPQNGGGLVANSLSLNTGTSTTGGVNEAQVTGLGTHGGPSGYDVDYGPEILCGLTSSQTSCGFPLAPGLQLVSPTMSPTSGNYSSSQTVTISNISPQSDSYYYTTCSTPGCTPATPTTSSTLVTGTITVTPPEAVSAIAARTSNPSSAVTTAVYVQPNATYVGSAGTNGTATAVTISGLSIPSGDIIVVGNGSSNTGVLNGVADSNSDTSTCGSIVNDTVNNYSAEACEMKAAATVTTITCKQTSGGSTINCLVAWYSPGTLSGTVDATAGADNQRTGPWSSGNTASLQGSSDLVVDFWFTCCSTTSTYSDGSTQRVVATGTYNSGLSDRTGWGSSPAYASGKWSGLTDSGSVVVIAIK
jgi:hypothetical protein